MRMSDQKAHSRKWFESLAGQVVDDFKLEAFLGHGKIGYVYRACSQIVEGRKIMQGLSLSFRIGASAEQTHGLFERRLSLLVAIQFFK